MSKLQLDAYAEGKREGAREALRELAVWCERVASGYDDNSEKYATIEADKAADEAMAKSKAHRESAAEARRRAEEMSK